MQPGLELRELGAGEFLANLDACTSVYAAAMDPPEYQLPGRLSIMERHAGYAAFRAVAAIRPAAIGASAGAAVPPSPNGQEPAVHLANGNGSPDGPVPLVGFTYGFHGENGQWWHDLVSHAVTGRLGHSAAQDWLSDSLEIAEVHVLPGYQGLGTGLAMMRRLTTGRPERTAVLSTMDADTRARRLYRGLGFTDLIAHFAFAGTESPYAIMGAPLPLPGASPRPDSPSLS